MLWLIKNVETYTPESIGIHDILITGSMIAHINGGIEIPEKYCRIVDGRGLKAVPGFIDCHVHITGGGGEGGFATRTPELQISDAAKGGVTTIVGTLGTDGVARSMPALLAKARGLEEEGISTFIYTGAYGVPVRTITGRIEDDIMLIDKVVGVGEVAISDHRSSQPTVQEIARIAADARRGGLLSGKAGVLNVHLGDGPRRLSFLNQILDETEIPSYHFLPTHMNRNPELFEEGIAYAKRGGFVDFTTSTVPLFLEEGEVKCSVALRRMLEAGVDPTHITFSSDGQGSLPAFDTKGHIVGYDVGRVTSLWPEVRDAVLQENIPLETALKVITTNPARILRLKGKGEIAVGKDADLVLLDKELRIHSVIAKGRMLMDAGKVLVHGLFEHAPQES